MIAKKNKIKFKLIMKKQKTNKIIQNKIGELQFMWKEYNPQSKMFMKILN